MQPGIPKGESPPTASFCESLIFMQEFCGRFSIMPAQQVIKHFWEITTICPRAYQTLARNGRGLATVVVRNGQEMEFSSNLKAWNDWLRVRIRWCCWSMEVQFVFKLINVNVPSVNFHWIPHYVPNYCQATIWHYQKLPIGTKVNRSMSAFSTESNKYVVQIRVFYKIWFN